jgi:hypothetical protein
MCLEYQQTAFHDISPDDVSHTGTSTDDSSPTDISIDYVLPNDMTDISTDDVSPTDISTDDVSPTDSSTKITPGQAQKWSRSEKVSHTPISDKMFLLKRVLS